MNNKNIIFLIIVLSNTALLGMNGQKSLLLKNIPTDIQTQIFEFANIKQQWWYLDKKNDISFDYKKNPFGTEVHDKNDISIVDLKTNKTIDFFNLNCWVLTASISPSKNFLATGSGTNYARLFDMQKKKKSPLLMLMAE